LIFETKKKFNRYTYYCCALILNSFHELSFYTRLLTRTRTSLFANYKTIKLGFGIYSKVYMKVRVADFA